MRALSKVIHAIRVAQRRHSILPPSSRVLIALSGGQDSTALTEALVTLHKSTPWRSLTAAYCDHGWPLDAGNAEQVTKYASTRNLPSRILQTCQEVPMKEAAAREWRYGILAEYATELGCTAVVTAHTMTDVSETLLMGLSRGAVVPIPWERNLTPRIKLVRPLLEIPRAVTRTVCEEQDIEFWEDAYNDDEKYLRNRVRKRVFPTMQDHLNPRVEEGFSRVADVLREEHAFLEEVTATLYEAVVRYDDGVWINGPVLKDVHRAVRRRVVKRALSHVSAFGKCVYSQVEAVCEVIEGRRGACIKGGREVSWVGDEVFIPIQEGDRALSNDGSCVPSRTEIESQIPIITC